MSADATYLACPKCGTAIRDRGLPIHCCGRAIRGPRPAPATTTLACVDRGEVDGSTPCRTCGGRSREAPLYRCRRFDELVPLRRPGTVAGQPPWSGRNCLDCIAGDD